MQNEPPKTPDNGKKILCIEDERFISELYARAMRKAGYDIKIVVDGKDALQEALTDTYDIILLDIMIPSLTGFEILRKLRGKDASPVRAKVIVTTNLEQSEEDRAAIEKQADGYIIKAEVTPKQLVKFLDQLA
ncbi:MAG: response regulator [Candidatus Saccharibacteria bacterium]|nr:response regulator [Candidatus Saccharibacteria bacterium]